MLKVYSECCKNCLLSPDRIVSAARAKDVIEGCTRKQSYFVCHKASFQGLEIVCKKFYDDLGHVSQMIRIAERMNMVEVVPQTDTTRFPSYKEQQTKKPET